MAVYSSWDRTSACEGASGCRNQFIFYLTHPPNPCMNCRMKLEIDYHIGNHMPCTQQVARRSKMLQSCGEVTCPNSACVWPPSYPIGYKWHNRGFSPRLALADSWDSSTPIKKNYPVLHSKGSLSKQTRKPPLVIMSSFIWFRTKDLRPEAKNFEVFFVHTVSHSLQLLGSRWPWKPKFIWLRRIFPPPFFPVSFPRQIRFIAWKKLRLSEVLRSLGWHIWPALMNSFFPSFCL